MSKTKKQLRAEAVERLRLMNAATGIRHIDVIKALTPDVPRTSQDIRAALIDLLTDDEPQERTKTEQNGVISEIPEESDTREKLVADIKGTSESDWFVTLETIERWLDRQAAITERECADTSWVVTLPRMNGKHIIAELQAKVDDLEALREEACKICSDSLVDELTGRVNELTAENTRLMTGNIRLRNEAELAQSALDIVLHPDFAKFIRGCADHVVKLAKESV